MNTTTTLASKYHAEEIDNTVMSVISQQENCQPPEVSTVTRKSIKSWSKLSNFEVNQLIQLCRATKSKLNRSQYEFSDVLTLNTKKSRFTTSGLTKLPSANDKLGRNQFLTREMIAERGDAKLLPMKSNRSPMRKNLDIEGCRLVTDPKHNAGRFPTKCWARTNLLCEIWLLHCRNEFQSTHNE